MAAVTRSAARGARQARALLLLSASLLHGSEASTTEASAPVRLSAQIQDLSYRALSAVEEQRLSERYALDLAAALSLNVTDIQDLAGRHGRVSLAAVRSQEEPTSPRLDSREGPPGDGGSAAVLKGMCYGALPCLDRECGGAGLPSQDMMQEGYAAQWGADGRDDLGVMRSLGANAVRLYHSLGLEGNGSHNGFLDRAAELGLDVWPGYHTELANEDDECPKYDCFVSWRKATLRGFDQGLQRGVGWHPAVATLILLNEPDFFASSAKCDPPGAWCAVKAALSALDGVLAAEREAGVDPGRVKLAVTWSFAMRTSLDGTVTAPGVYGFQDMVSGVRDPGLAGYTPRTSQADFEAAFRTRWLHGMNTQAPWSYVQELISKDYAPYLPTRWFIGEYGANMMPRSVIESDVKSMTEYAAQADSGFLGTAVFQFQTAYEKGGSEMNFGLLGLGKRVVGQTGEVCDRQHPCRSWPVHCLDLNLPGVHLEGDQAERAQAVAAAWGGSVPAGGLCGVRRLGARRASTQLACLVRHGPNATSVEEVLGAAALQGQLRDSTVAVLGTASPAITGALLLGGFRAMAEPTGHFSLSAATGAVLTHWWALLAAAALAGSCARKLGRGPEHKVSPEPPKEEKGKETEKQRAAAEASESLSFNKVQPCGA